MRLSPAQWMWLKWSVSILEFVAFMFCIYSLGTLFNTLMSPAVPASYSPLDLPPPAPAKSDHQHVKIVLACTTGAWVLLELVRVWLLFKRRLVDSAPEFRPQNLREHLEKFSRDK